MNSVRKCQHDPDWNDITLPRIDVIRENYSTLKFLLHVCSSVRSAAHSTELNETCPYNTEHAVWMNCVHLLLLFKFLLFVSIKAHIVKELIIPWTVMPVILTCSVAVLLCSKSEQISYVKSRIVHDLQQKCQLFQVEMGNVPWTLAFQKKPPPKRKIQQAPFRLTGDIKDMIKFSNLGYKTWSAFDRDMHYCLKLLPQYTEQAQKSAVSCNGCLLLDHFQQKKKRTDNVSRRLLSLYSQRKFSSSRNRKAWACS